MTAAGDRDAKGARVRIAAPAFPGGEARLLNELGFRSQALAVAQKIAGRRGTTMAEELIRLQYLPADVWWEAVARDLGVRHFRDLYLAPKPIDARLPDARQFQQVRQVWHRTSDTAVLVVAPRGREIDQLKRDMALDPSMRHRIAVAAPPTIRRAFRHAYEPAMTHQAINRLRVERPLQSASAGSALIRRLVGWCAAALALALAVPAAVLAGFDLLFLVAGGLRLAAAISRPRQAPPPALPDHLLPSYSVLIPLYRETAVVGDLIRAIGRIDYPRDRLSVHLVVEADDRDTLQAALATVAGTAMRVIAVPPSKPRTKPKALDWALPFVDGTLLTVFDAEDRPAPDQLRLAAAAFAAGPADLLCVQAILDIDHAAPSRNWLARQFALEYRVLFRLLLPWLAAHRLFLPIGGTSNHFRTDALVRMGGWDPFNVTEDADISVRIQREGGHIGVIPSTTMEEAPLNWRGWHLQRTRWMKGWLQTWLVHMGQPFKLLADLGFRDFVAFQVLILGQVVSALAYPFGILLVLLDLLGLIPLFADRDFGGDLVLAFQLLALGCGWLGTAAAMLATREAGTSVVRYRDLATVPIYWFLLFAAAVHAIAELIVDPHRWNKTRHGLAKRSGDRGRPRFPLRRPDAAADTPPDG